MIKKFPLILIFLLISTYIVLAEISIQTQNHQKQAEYLYAIEKLYYEDLFVNRELYTLEDFKNHFLEKLKIEEIDLAFKETVYKFIKDPYLEIKEAIIYQSNYYQEKDVRNDMEIRKIVIEDHNLEICYLKFKKISPNMAKKYREYLKNNIKQSDLLIIDLTGNFGGSLWSAAFFVGMFFEPGQYLFSVNFLKKDKIKTQNFYNSTDYGGLFTRNFIAVLQDDTTASAAEVISGVLKRRAIVFGDITYGKPYIQSTFDVGKYTIIYTNAFLNFGLELKPHEKIKPDFYLSNKEINDQKVIVLFLRIYLYLRNSVTGG